MYIHVCPLIFLWQSRLNSKLGEEATVCMKRTKNTVFPCDAFILNLLFSRGFTNAYRLRTVGYFPGGKEGVFSA